ncbi:hypothetical protein [Methylobacter sp.]|uniref:hypothetical protein n=1 Tax=Methylobacter sp. TaxID=2051955 RepID=UPI0011F9125B|nr:hypothetical protein [Methylobacter sp.]TAK59661.1 MAG: hypothetical protein EPO18_20015 [Methylobacter sp.]
MFGFHLKYLIILFVKKPMYSDVEIDNNIHTHLYACPFPDWKDVFIFEMNTADSVSLIGTSRAAPAVSLRVRSVVTKGIGKIKQMNSGETLILARVNT